MLEILLLLLFLKRCRCIWRSQGPTVVIRSAFDQSFSILFADKRASCKVWGLEELNHSERDLKELQATLFTRRDLHYCINARFKIIPYISHLQIYLVTVKKIFEKMQDNSFRKQ